MVTDRMVKSFLNILKKHIFPQTRSAEIDYDERKDCWFIHGRRNLHFCFAGSIDVNGCRRYMRMFYERDLVQHTDGRLHGSDLCSVSDIVLVQSATWIHWIRLPDRQLHRVHIADSLKGGPKEERYFRKWSRQVNPLSGSSIVRLSRRTVKLIIPPNSITLMRTYVIVKGFSSRKFPTMPSNPVTDR